MSEGSSGTGSAEPQGVTSTPWTPEVQRGLAAAEVEGGRLTQDQANELLRNGGVDPVPSGPYIAKEGIAGEIDAAFPPAMRPTDYRIPPLAEFGKEPTAEHIQTAKQAGEWLYAARFTPEIGTFVATELKRVVEKTAGMSEIEHTLWVQAEDRKLENLWGPETDRMTRLAAQLVEEVDKKQPGLKAYMLKVGALDSAMVVTQWALQAKRLYDRGGK